ncbi:MAG: prepilin-type N-terminal cleavage/methylation domain-containing protein [Phycisphaerales bacterium]|nr:MAG: prepilin-type N-terminal cleavage/methylation domain-containing protein [Phycisphaerales bacterium]
MRTTMPTYSALTHTDSGSSRRAATTAYGVRKTQYAVRNTRYGFTLIELIIVVIVVALLVLLAQVNLFGLLGRNTFEAQIQEFVSTMQMAVAAAAQSERRYEVIVDLVEQGFLLREITSPDLSEVLEEEIIVQSYFNDNCRVAYVEFDDGEYTSDTRAKFRAGHAGWHYGGKIVLLDEDELPYSVVVNRLNRIVQLREGDVELLVPRPKDEVPF